MDKKDLRNKKIAVLLGGESSEREVSLKSGGAVYKALKSLSYDAVAIDAVGDVAGAIKRKKIDIAFIALHGGHGENGALQGMLEVMNIPYTGSGVLASALAMDKEASKMVFAHHGIPTPQFKTLRRDEYEKAGSNPSKVKAGFSLPWVVKPSSEGSSVGVEIVKDRKALGRALSTAFSYGASVVIEKYVKGREIQIAILNGLVLGGVEVRPSAEFYSYEAKYTAGLTEYVIPPKITKREYDRAKAAALSAHKALGCSGATRVDLILDQDGNVYVLEVNTIPGMTETSLLPKIARSAGLEFPQLIEAILGGVGA